MHAKSTGEYKRKMTSIFGIINGRTGFLTNSTWKTGQNDL